jgi:glycosyltransferase involved in cell wall biosynthesis
MAKCLIMVGAFVKPGAESRAGGVAFACSSLASGQLGKAYELVRVASEGDDIFIRSGWRRLPAVFGRMARLIGHVLWKRDTAVILFTSHGNSFLEKGLMARVAALLGAKVLLLPRSGHLIEQVARGGWFAGYVRWALRGADVVVCQSEFWKTYFTELVGKGARTRFAVVENWLHDSAFVPAAAAVSSSGGDRFVVGFFNRIEAAKGIYDFVAAVKRAHRAKPRIRGVIYGDGHCMGDLRQHLAERGLEAVIEVAGWIGGEVKVERLRALDCCLFTSRVEGFPNSLLEMLALKVPVVATRVGAVPDVIHDGELGLLVEPADVDGMASAILALEGDEPLRVRLAEQAYDHVRHYNTLHAAEDKLMEIIS